MVGVKKIMLKKHSFDRKVKPGLTWLQILLSQNKLTRLEYCHC